MPFLPKFFLKNILKNHFIGPRWHAWPFHRRQHSHLGGVGHVAVADFIEGTFPGENWEKSKTWQKVEIVSEKVNKEEKITSRAVFLNFAPLAKFGHRW
jgi:hypothetical protein